ncbi:MAG: hypothetical protein ABI456_02900 [Ktedonobacteraceae bacterium]
MEKFAKAHFVQNLPRLSIQPIDAFFGLVPGFIVFEFEWKEDAPIGIANGSVPGNVGDLIDGGSVGVLVVVRGAQLLLVSPCC